MLSLFYWPAKLRNADKVLETPARKQPFCPAQADSRAPELVPGGCASQLHVWQASAVYSWLTAQHCAAGNRQEPGAPEARQGAGQPAATLAAAGVCNKTGC